jgi:hypothetical protein
MSANVHHGNGKSASSSGSDEDGMLDWELDYIGGTNADDNQQVVAKLVARMDALEAENKLVNEKKGLCWF